MPIGPNGPMGPRAHLNLCPVFKKMTKPRYIYFKFSKNNDFWWNLCQLFHVLIKYDMI